MGILSAVYTVCGNTGHYQEGNKVLGLDFKNGVVPAHTGIRGICAGLPGGKSVPVVSWYAVGQKPIAAVLQLWFLAGWRTCDNRVRINYSGGAVSGFAGSFWVRHLL